MSAEPSEADRLFYEGRELLKEGRLEEACDKLEQSQKLDPSSGTLLNLAHCHEAVRRYATAHAEFSEAARLAVAQKAPKREAEALKRAEALLPRLSYLVVRVLKSVPKLEVERDGVKVGEDGLDRPIPVDPGSHSIRASAPGYTPWSVMLTVVQPGELVVNVPELTETPSVPVGPTVAVASSPGKAEAAAPAREPKPEPPADRSLPAAFWVSAGATVLATGVATVSGILSLNSYAAAEDACPAPHESCSPEAMADRDRAGTQARIADVAAVTAVVAAGVGVYLFVANRTATRQAGQQSVRGRASQPALAWTW